MSTWGSFWRSEEWRTVSKALLKSMSIRMTWGLSVWERSNNVNDWYQRIWAWSQFGGAWRKPVLPSIPIFDKVVLSKIAHSVLSVHTAWGNLYVNGHLDMQQPANVRKLWHYHYNLYMPRSYPISWNSVTLPTVMTSITLANKWFSLQHWTITIKVRRNIN